MLKEIRPAIIILVGLTLITGVAYPLAMTGIAGVIFPRQAQGSIIEKDGKVIGSALIGQSFSDVKYFHPRPSAAGNGYDPTNSGGSNLGPTSSNLVANITANIATYRADNNIATNSPIYNMIPADAVTESASGLDPHISPANAEIQIARVAKARGISEGKLRELVRQNTSGRDLGLLGEPRVNVMTLNFALDNLAK